MCKGAFKNKLVNTFEKHLNNAGPLALNNARTSFHFIF